MKRAAYEPRASKEIFKKRNGAYHNRKLDCMRKPAIAGDDEKPSAEIDAALSEKHAA